MTGSQEFQNLGELRQGYQKFKISLGCCNRFSEAEERRRPGCCSEDSSGGTRLRSEENTGREGSALERGGQLWRGVSSGERSALERSQLQEE